jgi:hypothetical protein
MDIGELRSRQVNNEEDNQVQVLSNSNVLDDTNQASGSHDNVQDQQVASTSSRPNDQASASNVPTLQPTNIARDHPLDTIIGDISRDVQIRSRLASFYEHFSFVSFIETKKIEEALRDVDLVNAMHEELNNFTINQVWELVKRPKNHNVIGTKWVFRNKQDQDGIIVRNKARLVVQGYTQVGGLDFEENMPRLLDWKQLESC